MMLLLWNVVDNKLELECQQSFSRVLMGRYLYMYPATCCLSVVDPTHPFFLLMSGSNTPESVSASLLSASPSDDTPSQAQSYGTYTPPSSAPPSQIPSRSLSQDLGDISYGFQTLVFIHLSMYAYFPASFLLHWFRHGDNREYCDWVSDVARGLCWWTGILVVGRAMVWGTITCIRAFRNLWSEQGWGGRMISGLRRIVVE